MKGVNSFDQTKFWSAYKSMFGLAPATQAEVGGTNFLLNAIANDARLERVEWGAFLLGTIRNECGAAMQPIKEIKAKPNSEIWIEYQSKYWNTNFMGRGYSQLTLEGNYRQFSLKLYGDLRLVQNPDLVMQSQTGYDILSVGSVEGMFRGRANNTRYKLSDFLNDVKTDFLDARQIVNGMQGLAFRWAQRYAGYAEKYNTCLKIAAVQ